MTNLALALFGIFVLGIAVLILSLTSLALTVAVQRLLNHDRQR